jgi:ribosomal protein L11 methyltransferase
VELPESLEEETAGYLQTLGALGAEARPAGEGRVRLEVSYREAEAAERGRRALEAFLAAQGQTAPTRMASRTEEPWVERYERSRRPLDLPGGFRVLPAAPADLSSLAGRTLLLPPGRAFGTGEHPTTRLVLAEMVAELRPGRALLDLGTGSALLALAAARLGASPVLGVDHDPEALEVARENRSLNGLEGSLTLAAGTIDCARAFPFDLVLANLFRRPLEEVAGPVSLRQRPGGRCVLSGFGPSDLDDLARTWEGRGYRRVRESREGEWACLTLRRGEEG